MPQLEMRLPEIPDVEWKDAQYGFNGSWMPDVDPSLIGAENFAKCENTRYKDKGLEGVSGYTYINGTAITTYTEIRNGFQLQSPFTIPSYNMVHAINSSDQGRVYQNQTAIGSTGNFEATSLHTDASTGLQGRFSDAPQGNVVYTNSEESMIWAGNEKRTAVIFLCSDEEGSNLLDKTDDINSSLDTETMTFSENLVANGTMETASTGWTAIDAGTTTNERSATTDPVHSGTYSWKMIVEANDDGIDSDAFTMTDGVTYTITAWVYSAAETKIAMEILDGDTASLDDTEYTLVAGQWNKISINVESENTGAGALVRFNASTGGAGTFFIDDVTCVPQGANTNLIVMTTRPAKGFKFYVDSANATTSTMSAFYWNGAAWTAVASGSDGTRPAAISLAQSGTYSFTDTVDVAKPKHNEELFLYAYMFTLSAGDADIYHMTVD